MRPEVSAGDAEKDAQALEWAFYEKDKLLYQEGYYNSPDFYHAIWDRWNLLLVAVIFLFLLYGFQGFRHGNPVDFPDQD